MKSKPPKWILKLFQRLCPDELADPLIGDLLEQYELNLQRTNITRARLLFIYNGLKMTRLFIFRRERTTRRQNSISMLINYLKTTLRNFRKQSAYYLINFIGLVLGLTCCALVVLFVRYEFSYDDFHQNPKNTYRITSKIYQRTWFPSIQDIYAERITGETFPEIEKFVKFRRAPQRFAIYEGNRFATRTLVTNPGSQFLDIFNFESVEGNPSQMFKEPNSIVFTESTAEALLGEAPYIGKIIEWDTLTLKVTGILQDLPSNTHLTFNAMVAADVQFFGVFAYAVLPPNTNLESFQDKVVNLDIPNNRFPIDQVNLQPIEDVHLASPLTFELKPPGDKGYLYLFSGIAFFILLISTTNFVNLSTAIYANRTREVAIRKVLGSSKWNLSIQFLSESIMFTLLTLPMVVLLVELLLPSFGNLVGTSLNNEFLKSANYLLTLVAIALMVGLISGLYPILKFSGLPPTRLFRKHNPQGAGHLKLRKVLLTLQFTLLIFLGTGAFFINDQLQFVQKKDLGILKEGVIKVTNAYNIQRGEQYRAIKNQSLLSPHILGFTTGMPPGTETFGQPYKAEGHEERSDALSFWTDLDYFDVMEVEGLYGDFFEKEADQLPEISMVVNEKFVEVMGWDNPIGKRVTLNLQTNPIDRMITGVFKNYHTLSLHSEIVPQFIFVRKNMRRASQDVLVKINMQNIQASIDALEESWYDVLPDTPIQYEFMDEGIQKAYEQEQRAGNFSMILSVVAVFLAVMGLVGLAAYMAKLRIKEIGVRKVLGASLRQILVILNKEFIALVILATVIAGVVSFYTVSGWLDSFAYRTSIKFFVFPLAGVLVFAVTLATVSIQSAKTAMQNPIKALRHE